MTDSPTTSSTSSRNATNKADIVLDVDKCKSNIDTLKELCTENADYFAKDTSENGQRLNICFLAIKDELDGLWPRMLRIQEQVHHYDFDESTPGNGYRSFLHVANSAINYTLQLSKDVSLKKDSVLFRKSTMTKEVECCSQLVSSLDTCLKHLEVLISWGSKGSLFPDEDHSPLELLSNYEDINQYCFYGRCLGFQFSESLRNALQFIALSMVVFSEAYYYNYSNGNVLVKATNSVRSSTKYITDPEQRARRIVNISQKSDIDFCKSFWFLSESELMSRMPSVGSSAVAVSKIINLPPSPLTLEINKQEIEIPIPNSYLGRKTLSLRLISSKVREGMIGAQSVKNPAPLSRGLIFHCHGGGFVALSSKSHEGYLRDWAKELDVPILSVDYSLAPEAPFPRALEEVTYAYSWMLKNLELLGTTGERIIVAGDSAGGNLVLANTLKCLEMNLPLPVGIFTVYTPTLVNFVPSPARLLCMMDPLLPFGFMMRCLKAYACADPKLKKDVNPNDTSSDTESFEEISESDLMELQAHKSPISETSDTLTYGSLSSHAPDVDRSIDLSTFDVEQSEQYVSDCLERYVLDSDTDTDGTKVPVLKPESVASSQTFDSSIQIKVTNFVSNLKTRFTRLLSERNQSGAEKFLDMERETNLLEECRFVVPKDPYLSPFCAADEDLKRFPPTRVLTVHLDPCLDDCVMFAKRLKSLEVDVKLDLIGGLPHGFLNFSQISKEAQEASKVCVERMKELLNLDNLPPNPSQ